jgi:hypothetical protein
LGNETFYETLSSTPTRKRQSPAARLATCGIGKGETRV